jgi:hypothetical protein
LSRPPPQLGASSSPSPVVSHLSRPEAGLISVRGHEVWYNLTSLHEHEEELRGQSLAEIQARADLSDHWSLIAEAKNAIYAFTHDIADVL